MLKKLNMHVGNSFCALGIAFCARVAALISFIYGIALFFIVYPSDWLAYLFLCSHALGVVSSFSLSSLLKTDIKRNTFILLSVAVFLFGLFAAAAQLSLNWLPFVVASSAGVVGSICEGAMMSAISLAFSMQEYKKIAQFIERMSFVSVISGSCMIPLLMAYFPLEALLFASIFFTGLGAIFLRKLTLIPKPVQAKTPFSLKSVLGNPLSRQITFFIFFTTFIWKCIEYVFQFELSQNYEGKDLADFQGYYSAIANVVGLTVSLSSTRYLLILFRPEGIIRISLFFTVLGCLLFIFVQSFWALCVLSGMRIAFYYNYVSISLNILLNIIPTHLLSGTRFVTKTLVPNSANLLAALFLILSGTGYISAMGIIVICFVMIFPLFYFAKKMGEEYGKILKDESAFKRFYLQSDRWKSWNLAVAEVPGFGFPQIAPSYAIIESDQAPNKLSYEQDIARIDEEENLLDLAKGKTLSERSKMAKEMFFCACFQGDERMYSKNFAKKMVLIERECLRDLSALLPLYPQSVIQTEILSRLEQVKINSLYWVAIATHPIEMSLIIPTLLKMQSSLFVQEEQEKAIELLEIYVRNPFLFDVLIELLKGKKESVEKKSNGHFNDPWLERVIRSQIHPSEELEMHALNKVFHLRKTALFNELQPEALLAIAQEAREIAFNAGEVIFSEGEFPNGLYCVCSGKVKFIRQGNLLNQLGENDFFGELGLIDGHPRTASAIAETACSLLLLEKSTFDRITEDLPEVLRCLTKIILSYLRASLNNQKAEGAELPVKALSDQARPSSS